MNRRTADKSPPDNPMSWMITFSDMVTLLLTFFVMIIAITSQDPKQQILTQSVGEFQGIIQGNGVLYFADRPHMAPALDIVENMDLLPEEVLFDQEEIKSAVFQLDPAKTLNYETLELTVNEEVDIFKDERGLVIRWDQNVLFPEGSNLLRPEYQTLLERLAAFLINVSLPISVESHTNPFSELEGGSGSAGYAFSLMRSKVVMEYLVSLGIPEKRFRIGGYGGSRPLTEDPAVSADNSRLEIVIYQPGQSSWNK